MKTLVVGFKGKNNPSAQLACLLQADCLLLTNSFPGLELQIHDLGQSYDAIYMFGIDKNLRKTVRIEKTAQNGDQRISTEFDIQYLSDRMQNAGIAHYISAEPTQYLCNAAYYCMLQKNKNTVFVHIPSLRGMDSILMEQLFGIFQKMILSS